MTRPKISDAATETLTSWFDQLQEGARQIGELPLAVEAFVHLGYTLGRESRQPEVERLNHECNTLWMRAFTPKERHAEYQKRMDRYFADQDAAFFAAPAQLNSNSIPIGADRVSAVERRPHDGSTETRGARAA